MLRDEAYVAGFCKAAAVIGVDPVALYKCAAPGWFGRLWSRGVNLVRQPGNLMRRYGELMSASRYNKLDARASSIMSQLHPDKFVMVPTGPGGGMVRVPRRARIAELRSRLKAVKKLQSQELGGLESGGSMDRFNELTTRASDIERQISGISPPDRETARLLKQRLAAYRRMQTDEGSKVIMARLGTLGAGAGAYAGVRALGGNQDGGQAQQQQQPQYTT